MNENTENESIIEKSCLDQINEEKIRNEKIKFQEKSFVDESFRSFDSNGAINSIIGSRLLEKIKHIQNLEIENKSLKERVNELETIISKNDINNDLTNENKALKYKIAEVQANFENKVKYFEEILQEYNEKLKKAMDSNIEYLMKIDELTKLNKKFVSLNEGLSKNKEILEIQLKNVGAHFEEALREKEKITTKLRILLKKLVDWNSNNTQILQIINTFSCFFITENSDEIISTYQKN